MAKKGGTRTNIFELQEQSVKLANLNLRQELHGESHVTAADLKFELKSDADILAMFSPALKDSLFKKKEDLAGGTLELKNPQLKPPLSLEYELKGIDFTVHYGAKSEMHFENADVDSFKIEPAEGGAVTVTFRVAIHPSGAQIGKLADFIQETIDITLVVPDLPEAKAA